REPPSGQDAPGVGEAALDRLGGGQEVLGLREVHLHSFRNPDSWPDRNRTRPDRGRRRIALLTFGRTTWPCYHVARSPYLPHLGGSRVADGTFDRLAGMAGIVTGAARGIGEACATRLASHGARVVLADRDEDALEETAKRIAAAGGNVSIQPVDVRQWSSVDALCRACV